jgi:rhodanese-related sulfurtransferase
MPMKLKKNAKDLVAAAETEVETLSVADAIARHARDDGGTVFVDLRDIRELWRDGKVSGAFHAPRGMLEFWVDPESEYHRDVFSSGKALVFYCRGGQRSALAAKAVQDMGLSGVAHIGGGFTAWTDAGGPTEEVKPKPRR